MVCIEATRPISIPFAIATRFAFHFTILLLKCLKSEHEECTESTNLSSNIPCHLDALNGQWYPVRHLLEECNRSRMLRMRPRTFRVRAFKWRDTAHGRRSTMLQYVLAIVSFLSCDLFACWCARSSTFYQCADKKNWRHTQTTWMNIEYNISEGMTYEHVKNLFVWSLSRQVSFKMKQIIKTFFNFVIIY